MSLCRQQKASGNRERLLSIVAGKIPLAALALCPLVSSGGDVHLGVGLTAVVLRFLSITPVTHSPCAVDPPEAILIHYATTDVVPLFELADAWPFSAGGPA